MDPEPNGIPTRSKENMRWYSPSQVLTCAIPTADRNISITWNHKETIRNISSSDLNFKIVCQNRLLKCKEYLENGIWLKFLRDQWSFCKISMKSIKNVGYKYKGTAQDPGSFFKGSIHFFQWITKSKQRSNWGGWVGYGLMDVHTSKFVGFVC